MSDGPSPRPLDRVPAVWLVLASIISIQVGASFAKGLFAHVGPLQVSWLRFASAAVLLWLLFRPWRALAHPHSRREWGLLAAFVVALVVMNITIYLAFTRVPIGLAVTLEFLGPLTVAVVGSQRALDLVWAGLALLGVALLGLGPAALDPLGVALALAAGACWATYIVIGGKLGDAWRGVDALAVACAVGAVVLAPVALGRDGTLDPRVLGVGAAVGILSTVLPYSLELSALRRIPRATFGILMSLEPAAAALAALLVLGERLGWVDVVAMAAVMVASAGSTLAGRRP